MNSLKIDKTKLLTIKSYSEKIGKSRQRVYQMAEEGLIKIVEIDKVKFVEI